VWVGSRARPLWANWGGVGWKPCAHTVGQLLEELDGYAEGRSMAATDVAALARLDAPRLCRIGLLSSVCDTDAAAPGGSILGGTGAEMAVAELAMGLPRPVDAAGRPAMLTIKVGCGGPPGAEQDLNSVLAAAGRGWATVHWAPRNDGPADEGVDGPADSDGGSG
jgi:hypothetical protein